MAEVFLAKAVGPMGFEKTVVVKRIRPLLVADPHFVEMFLSEAKLTSQLNHPNIVQIFDFGVAEGNYFIAMEYIDGFDLRLLSKKARELGKPLTFLQCAKIISYACEGLAYAHDFTDPKTDRPLDLVHRDVSPDNIILAKNGSVKVLDFGIAKAALQLHKTQAGFLKGKLGYMSPEHFRGKTLDRRADVFALGVVLYELVANKKPYDAISEVSIIRAVLYEPLVPVRQRRQDVPVELEKIIDRALMREREDRYQTCHEMQADLERFIASTGQPLSALQLSQFVTSLRNATGGSQSQLPAVTPNVDPTTSVRRDDGRGKKSGSRQAVNPHAEEPKAAKPERAQHDYSDGLSTVREDLDVPLEDLDAPLEEPDSATSTMREMPGLPPNPADSTTLMRVVAQPEPQGSPSTAIHRPPRRTHSSRSNPSLKALRPEAPRKAPGSRAPVIALAVAALALIGGGIAFVSASRSSQNPKPPPAVADTSEPTQQPAAPAEGPPAAQPRDDQAPKVANPTKAAPAAQPPERPEPPPEKELPKSRPGDNPSQDPKLATLKIVTNVPAQVKIGKRRGKSPYAVELKPGQYDVELVDPTTTFWMRRFNVELKAGERRTETIDLEKGTLVFNSFPEATVYVDEVANPVGVTPAKVELLEGAHRIRFECSKKPQPDVQEVIVEPGKQTRVMAKYK